MDFKNLKITEYEDSVSALPDYPSDSGITAAQLKAIFDGRTDKEIKTKFNALIDELITKFGLVEVDIADAVEQHQQSEEAHIDLFTPIRERIAEILGQIISLEATDEELQTAISGLDLLLSGKADRDEVEKKVDKVAGKGLSSNDFTDEWKASIQNVFNEAIYAQTSIDEHRAEKSNPHNVTAAQIGALTSESLNDELGKYLPEIENDIGMLKEQLGEIDSALDAILAIQNKLTGDESI